MSGSRISIFAQTFWAYLLRPAQLNSLGISKCYASVVPKFIRGHGSPLPPSPKLSNLLLLYLFLCKKARRSNLKSWLVWHWLVLTRLISTSALFCFLTLFITSLSGMHVHEYGSSTHWTWLSEEVVRTHSLRCADPLRFWIFQVSRSHQSKGLKIEISFECFYVYHTPPATLPWKTNVSRPIENEQDYA